MSSLKNKDNHSNLIGQAPPTKERPSVKFNVSRQTKGD